MGNACLHHTDPIKSRRNFLLQSAACDAGLLLPATERTYFCTCYGTVEIEDQHRTEKRLVVSG